MKRKYIYVVLFLILTSSLTACKQLDVIGNKSVTSFEQVLNTIPDNIQADDTLGGWSLTAPDGKAKFIWSKDFSKSKEYDVMIEMDSKPFVDAGLDISKLPSENVLGDKIVVGTNLSDEAFNYDADITPIASYKKIVDLSRESIQFHGALDHFGVNLTNGNAFEWAKDLNTNDKDIVFALNPQIFIDAGVDPSKVEGWAFAKVEMMDMHGKDIQVDKFLKPFNIK